MKLRVFITAALLLVSCSVVRAQTADFSGGYNLGSDRQRPAAIFQAFGDDRFGDTYARTDFSLKPQPLSLGTAYLEIARSFVFWKNTPLEGIGLHAEFNGFMNMDQCNWLFGVDYTLPVKGLYRVSVLYKTFNGNSVSKVPLQLSFLWDVKDIFQVKGLQFRGLAKVWGEDIKYWYNDPDPRAAEAGYFVIKAAPQIWYSVGQFAGWDGLSLGGEVELSYNYLGCSGFHARPFAGIRLSF